MGGKTKQRVAGNVKPANSGRIRELLTNQQQGTGNIITFSALAKSQQQQTSLETKSQSISLAKTNESHPPEQTKTTPTPPKDDYRLIVKRVGDREMYTRVKISDAIQYSDQFKPAISPSDTGVKKPSYLLDSGPIENRRDDNEVKSEQQDDCDNSPGNEPTDPEEEYDFDTLLDQIAGLQIETDKISTTLFNSLTEEQTKTELHMLKIFKLFVDKFSSDLSLEDWDLIIRSLYKWIGWISKAELPVHESYQADLGVDVFNFINYLIMFAKSLKQEGSSEQENPMLQSLLADWDNFHSSNLFQDLLVLYFKCIAIENSEDRRNHTVRPMIESLAQIVVDVDPRLVLSHYSLSENIETKIESDTELELPPNSIYCNVDDKRFKGFQPACCLLKSNYRVILVSGHSILRRSIDKICEFIQASSISDDEREDVPIFPPEILMHILTSRDSMMTALLSDYRAGDISVTIEPNTDSYACTLSYLFAWDLAIQMIVGIDKEVGHRIIHSLKKIGMIQRLLDNIFMLLPPLGVRDSLNFKIETDDDIRKTIGRNQPCSIQSFLKLPLGTAIRRPVNEIELVALHLYFSLALHMPVTVRKWYNNNSNKRLCNLVNEYTVKHISQVICSLEMESVQAKCQERASKDESKNLVIKARPSAKEVFALYTRDEFKMELTIKLPHNYPLGPIQIDGGKRVGVADNKWRSWLLQLTTFLSHQNGPILDGVDLWKKNLDKRFEGVEKCTICFSILHSNYQLPKKKCQTCANVFHNLCLYKWFESSGNSTCPLCRNAW